MRTWKIVSGILSIAISLFVVFQSFFAGAYNILTGNGQSSGTAGVVVAIMLLTGGIVSIATHNGGLGGNIAVSILCGIGGVVGLLAAGDYADLRIWAIWALLCAVIAMIGIASEVRADREEISVPVHSSSAPARYGPATFQDVILETDPGRRDAAIDALPEQQAKSYLKQALNVLVPRQAADDPDDDSGLIKVLVAALIIVACLIIGVVVIGVLLSSSDGRGAENSAPPAVSDRVQESEPAQEETSAPPIAPSSGAGTVGDYYVEIQSAFIANDHEGSPAIIVTYSWTNNSDRTTNALTVLSEKAYQHGVQLDRAIIYSSETPGYEANTSTRNLRPGATTEVQCAFSISDSTAEVELEISEFIGFSSDTVTTSFDLSALNTVE